MKGESNIKNVKKEAALVVGGILLGTALAAPVAGAVLTAQLSSQKIMVDGQPVQIEACVTSTRYGEWSTRSTVLGEEPSAWRDGKPLATVPDGHPT